MRIARHHHRARNNVALFNHHLVRDAGPGRVKIDAVLAGERFDLGVLLQILRCDILNVVIDSEHWLPWIADRCRADLLELWDHRAGIVMRHHMARADRDEVATPHLCSGRKSIRMTRRNLLDKGEAHAAYLASISFP